MGHGIDSADMGRTQLKFVPSRARYYVKCPYFLCLSNNRGIHIPYPQIASRKGNYFERNVILRISDKTGYEINRADRVTDLLKADGLYTLNRKVDTEFYAEKNIGLKVGMLKPDLILSEKTSRGVLITVLEIKNSRFLRPYHYLQAYVYKLTLERFLSQRTKAPVHVGASMIHLKEGFCPEDEFELDFRSFQERIAAMGFDSLAIDNFMNPRSGIALRRALQKIASLRPNTMECNTCPGTDKCEHNRQV
jgi:hypothetical protein